MFKVGVHARYLVRAVFKYAVLMLKHVEELILRQMKIGVLYFITPF